MALKIDNKLTPGKLLPLIYRVFELSAEKLHALETRWDPARGTPVFTVRGKYSSRGWTEWTQGFQFGSALLQFDATGENRWLELARERIVRHMASHVSHIGVHDHGFNNISTYGNLRRLIREGKVTTSPGELNFCELALKVSGAIQAARWTPTGADSGFIHSFNGPHSLFVDTVRSLRSLAVAHQLGHVLMGEKDRRISLLERLLQHGAATAHYNVYYGKGRDMYDVPGRTAHESIFNTNDGSYRCPSSQQGYSPFSTWTRGLAWAILGFAEQLEFLSVLKDEDASASAPYGPMFQDAAVATARFYIENACTDGIPYWDTGAPQLHRLRSPLSGPADPFNEWEPVDSSAAAIAGQGFIRLGKFLCANGNPAEGRRLEQAGLSIARTLFSEPYLSVKARHEGLLLHSVYHRPNGWDYVAPGQKVPNGESSMWGDYHLRELALLLLREARGEAYLTFFDQSWAPAQR